MFKAIALAIVGVAPFHIEVTPSSLTILENALNTFLQFLLSASGNVESAYILTRAKSHGVPMNEPIAPAHNDAPAFYKVVKFAPPFT